MIHRGFRHVPERLVEGRVCLALSARQRADRSQTYELALTQRYQEVAGTLRVNGKPFPVERAQLRGDRLTVAFIADLGGGPVRHELSGRVEGGAIAGSVRFSGDRVSGENDWLATRTGS